MSKAQEVVYALVGAGDFAVEKVANVRKVADRKSNTKLYKDFVKRGRSLSTKVKNSSAGKQVAEQTEPVRTQVQGAVKTVGKAFGVNVVSWPSSRRSTTRSTTKSAPRKTATRKTATRKPTTRKATSKAS